MSDDGQGGEQRPNNVTRLPRRNLRELRRPARASSESIDVRTAAVRQMLGAGAPYTPLGYDGTRFWLIQATGHVEGYTARDLTHRQLVGLCGGKDWLIKRYPRFIRGKPSTERFSDDAAAAELMVACQRMGDWTREDHVRGAGAWPGEEPGELVLHRGGLLIINGQTRPLGRHGEYVYEPSPSLPLFTPSLQAAANRAGADLVARLDTFAFEHGTWDSSLVFGFLCCALIGGALKFRPHLWLLGELGTGKSTLQALIQDLLGLSGIVAVTDATPAGIWQSIRHKSVPVSYDEAEPRVENSNIEEVVRVARQASSGGKILRGSAGHKAESFTIHNTFIMSSITQARLLPQDQSRFINILLQKRDDSAMLPLDTGRMQEIGVALTWRMVERFDYLTRIVQPEYKRLLREHGATDRIADLYSHVFAARAVALWDDMAGAHFERTLSGHHMKRIVAQAIADQQPSYQQCLGYLLTTRVDRARMESLTLGELLEIAGRPLLRAHDARRLRDGRLFVDTEGEEWIPEPTDGKANEARDRLLSFGLRVTMEPGEGGAEPYPALVVANQHRQLAEVYGATVWRSEPDGTASGWAQILRRVPGAKLAGKRRFRHGIYSRAVVLPLAEVLQPAPQPTPPDPIADDVDVTDQRGAALH